MKTSGGFCFFLIASCVFSPSVGFSQDAVFEEWPGTLKRAGKQKESVIFQVRISDKGPFILGMTYADTPFEFKKQKHEKDSFTFDWTPGENDSSCQMRKLESGDFKGECKLENSSKKIKMQMMPLNKDVTDADADADADADTAVAESTGSGAAPEKGGKVKKKKKK